MTVQDVEDVIKDFDKEWKKALEDAASGNLPIGTAQRDPGDKGKDKAGSKKTDTVEVPPQAQKRKDVEEVPPKAPNKKKTKALKPTTETALTEDDYDLIVAILKEEMRDSFQAMQTSQDKMQSTIDKQLLELKALTEKTTTMQILPVKATAGESSQPSISRKEVFAEDRTNIVLIPSGSIRFPALMIDV